MYRLHPLSLLFSLALSFLAISSNAIAQRSSLPEQATFARIQSARDVIDLWDNQRQVFVKGDIGVPDRQLNDLAEWLRTNGPHWTVVLMIDADGETYTAPDRRPYSGMDAVESALGKGLTNRTDFGQWTHPVTGETDGTIFVLFLKERKFAYFSSEAQDRRGLGRSHWIGDLDQPAFRAMRGGQRVVDAVKDTVKSINQRLARTIQEEKESARQAELERLRDLQNAKESITHVEELIDQVQAERIKLRERETGAQGELAAPPVGDWQEKLSKIETGLNEDNAGPRQIQLKQLGSDIDAFLNGYAALDGYGANRSDLLKAMAELSAAPNNVTEDLVRQLRQILDESDAEARNGDLDLTRTLRKAEEQIALGRKLWAEEDQRIEQELMRRQLVRQILFGVGIGMLFLFAGVLILLNRLRKATMERAFELLRSRESSILKETDGLDQLFTRSADLLGSRDRIDQRGYTGTTRALGFRALGDIDDLLIMNKEIRRVIEQSRSLIEPKGFWGPIFNLFSREAFDQSIRKLSGAPLVFSRASGIPIVLMDIVRQKAEANGQPVPTEIPDEVVLTFDEIYQAIQSRRVQAAQAIDKLEHSLISVNDELTRLQNELQSSLDQDTRLSNASDGDGWFAVPNYFDVVIPSAQEDVKQADGLSTTDAVAAIDGPIRQASRKLKEARTLANSIEDFRLKGLPEMVSLAENLRALGYPTSWMDIELDQRSQWANRLLERVSQESIDSETHRWKESIEQFMSSSREALALALRIRDQTTPSLLNLKNEIQEARQDLGKRLQLLPERMLVEPNLNPDDSLATAHRSLDAAATMLQQGKVQSCREALEGCDAAVAQAVATIESSQQSSREFNSRKTEQEERLRKATVRFENLWDQIRKAEQEYSDDSLRLAYSTPASTPSASEEQGDENALEREGQRAPQLLDRARDRANACSAILSNAHDLYRQGMLLGSMGKVQEAASLIAQMSIRLDRVADHLGRLESTVVENQKSLATSTSSVEQLIDAKRDRMVTHPTLEQIQAMVDHMNQIHQRHASSQARSNPFEFAQVLLSAQKRIAELNGMVVSDRHGYAEAQRALEGAVQQWQIANQYVKQSRTDNIPDSAATSEAVRRVDLLERNLLNVQQDFAQEHGDWRSINSRSASIQSELSAVSRQLSAELQQANATLEAFQHASKMVYEAENWTGQWGIRVQGSPGVQALEAARTALQRGQYDSALEASRRAYSEANTEIQRAERRVAARRMEIQQQEERKRREQMAAEARRYGGGVIGSGPSIFRGGSHGSSGGASSDDSSGFSRSGW